MSILRYLLAQRKVIVIFVFIVVFSQLIAGQASVTAQTICDSPANEIVAENCLPGNPPAEWDISGAGDVSIQGFATDISVNRGQTINFKIDTTAAEYQIDIYRLGYYQGNGARLIDTIPSTAVTATNQPACTFDAANWNLLDCGNWSVSASWPVPPDAASGVYIARPSRTDNGGASHIVFIVRNDASTADLLFQTSDTTWQSYNPYGGYNAYGSSGATMAEKLSYNRPFTTRGAELENWLFNAEYPMIRWLERNGYNVSYMAAVDTERHADLIPNHQVFLSVGHDEYWSQGRRDAVQAARDSGVHLAFFSGNEIYWKIRWEQDSAGQDYRTQVTFKEGSAAPSGSAEHRNCYNNYDCDPTDIWTGLWREAPGAAPENALSGQISWRLNTGPITVPGEFAPLRFWRNTDVANLGPTGQVTLSDGVLGYEWDPEYQEYADWYPPGRILLSTTNVNSFVGPEQHHLSLYRADSGALVFGAGTVQWSWGLDGNHDRGTSVEDPNMQQATVNLFADMDVQPASLQTGLVLVNASTDTTAPTSAITAPLAGAMVSGNVTITGTAVDTNGVVAGVELSVDGGSTWRRASGYGNWSFSWTPSQTGSHTILTRAVDDSGNIETPSAGITVTVEPRTCPCSLWDPATPGGPQADDSGAVELGVKFQTEVDGWVTAVRFYKTIDNTGVHIGNVWDASGNNLGSVTFAGETGTGWQEAVFAAPIPVTANTTYIASYYAPNGSYAVTNGYFATAGMDNPPLYALQDGVAGGNAVYSYAPTSTFPNQTYNSSNYWVDLVFVTDSGPDSTPPTVLAATPANNAAGVANTTAVTAVFNEPMNAATINNTTFALRDAANNLVPATVSYTAVNRTATLVPDTALAYTAAYTAVLQGGPGGVADLAGNEMAADYTWTFTTSAPPPPPPYEGPGGPILVVTTAANPFGTYFAEILRTEGFNAFAVADVAIVDDAMLSDYDVVILGEMALTGPQVTLLTDWVNDGGNLIAMRPDKQLASLLGLTDASATLAEAYLQVDTSSGPGVGIVGETIQFHGEADLYTLNGATPLAMLYADATTATANPAVTLVNVGPNGGQAAAFTYDLAKSVIYTRQGNPAWADTNGDGSSGPVRADDMFHNGTDPDWVDLDKVAIPQADEQQRLLANLILQTNLDNMPLPRFWYFPRGEKAVVVMTADDHANPNVPGRFDQYIAASPAGCSVDDWECVRSSVYIYTGTTLSEADAMAYTAVGFEIGAHIDTGCANYTLPQLQNFYNNQLAAFAARFPTLPHQLSERTHCIAWSGWDYQPTVKEQLGIRLDTNYYYWPPEWINDQPGLFTGSGMPMRFAAENGVMFDVYQATTQMTDESGQSFPYTIDTLINRALGPEGYYGVFTANMHSDALNSPGSDAIVASALSRGVPVISGRQMVTWLDGRNGSSFSNLAWSTSTLSFTIEIGAGANGLQTMVPAQSAAGALSSITLDGAPVAYTLQTIKGITYAIFEAGAGVVNVSYAADNTPPTATAFVPEAGAVDVPVDTAVRLTFNEPLNPATLNATTFTLRDAANNLVPATVTYDSGSNTAILTPDAALDSETTYTATALGGTLGLTDTAGNPLAANITWAFTTAAPPSCPCTIWDEETAVGVNGNDANSYELGVKFRSSQAGFITGLRFYKYAANTGTHSGHLWDVNGNLLGSATFTNETASGWQDVSFDPPIAITANTVYVASYATETGYYAFTANYFTTQGVDNGPLHALSAAESPAPGTNGVFSETPNQFPNTSFNDANYWVDVVFDTALPGDTTPPLISSVSAVPGAGGTAVITWTTNEPADSLVVYGTDTAVLDQSAAAATLVTNHQITLTGLDPSTTYYYRVLSADAAANTATYPEPPAVPLPFVTPGLSLVDTAVADFTAGEAGACYISEMASGELLLAPTIGAEFDGTALPVDWSDFSWTGGTAAVAGGAVFVDGARAATNSYYDAGRIIEFVATFQPEAFQHVGLGQDLAELTESWAMFSTFNTTTTLYARTLQGGAQVDTPLPGSWLGAPHRYRIEWTDSQVDFYIDGTLLHSQAVVISANMRPVISDYQNSGQGITVNWLHLSPYSDSCTFTSRVFDGGAVVDWLDAQWSGTTPTDTAVTVETRTGSSALPDGTWSAWQAVDVDGTMLNPNGRYAQYRLMLASTDASATPIVEEVMLQYAAGDYTPPQITILGDNPATVEVGDPYTDAGATALDDSDGDLTAEIVTTSTVDSNTIGSYTVTYAVEDSSGNVATAVRTVNVVDTGMPVITILGDNPATVEVGSSYVDVGATAFDTGDGDLTAEIVTTSTVDSNTIGSYTVTYTVEDSSGNVATAVRTVNVIDTIITRHHDPG